MVRPRPLKDLVHEILDTTPNTNSFASQVQEALSRARQEHLPCPITTSSVINSLPRHQA
jgi:hypothetical protein